VITYEGLRRLYYWTKENIRYLEDPEGFQWIRNPSRTWDDRGKGVDCKSFTVFLASIFQNLGLKHLIRFSAYEGKRPTHVYPVVYLGKQAVIMDCVYYGFDKEKSFTFKKDFIVMPEISRLSGFHEFEEGWEHQVSGADLDIAQMNEGEFFRRVYADTYGGVVAADIENQTSSNPAINDFLNQTAVMTKPAVGGIEGIGNVQKSFLGWLIKIGLPKVAPFFLFSFLKKPVNTSVDARRAKQRRILDWIGRNTNLDAPKVDALLRMGIFKKYQKQPEQILNASAKAAVAGLGVIPIPVDALVTLVGNLISKIAFLFKKKDAPQIFKADGSDLNLLLFVPEGTGPLVTIPGQQPMQSDWKGLPYALPAPTNTSPAQTEPKGNVQIQVYDKNTQQNPVLIEGEPEKTVWYKDTATQIGLGVLGMICIGGTWYYFNKQK
jgi:hypothetical protein